jgi:hypothetical protein
VEQPKGASPEYTPIFLANIRPTWRGTKTLAYCTLSEVTKRIKRCKYKPRGLNDDTFYGDSTIKLITALIYRFS